MATRGRPKKEPEQEANPEKQKKAPEQEANSEKQNDAAMSGQTGQYGSAPFDAAAAVPQKPKKKYPNARQGAKTMVQKKKKARIIEAMQDPRVAKMLNLVPVMPEESDYRTMSLDQIVEHINSLEGSPIRKINAFTIACVNISFGVNIKDTEDMRRRFWTYCAMAEACNMRITNMCAYHAMGIPNQVASTWRVGGVGSTKERRELIAEVDAVCAGSREMLAASGQLNPVLAIFWAKNFDGLRDVTEHVVAQGDPLGEIQTPEQIEERYSDLIEE